MRRPIHPTKRAQSVSARYARAARMRSVVRLPRRSSGASMASGRFFPASTTTAAAAFVLLLFQEGQDIRQAKPALLPDGAVVRQNAPVRVAADGRRADAENAGRLLQRQGRVQQTLDELL